MGVAIANRLRAKPRPSQSFRACHLAANVLRRPGDKISELLRSSGVHGSNSQPLHVQSVESLRRVCVTIVFPAGMVAGVWSEWYLCLPITSGGYRRENFAGWRKEDGMAGLDHGQMHPKEVEDPRIAVRNSRYGMVLFLVYLAFYGGFVGLNAFYPGQMEATPAFGLNLAILYGFALIVAAMVLALLYSWLCRAVGAAANGNGGP